jgi:hypothetical protein
MAHTASLGLRVELADLWATALGQPGPRARRSRQGAAPRASRHPGGHPEAATLSPRPRVGTRRSASTFSIGTTSDRATIRVASPWTSPARRSAISPTCAAGIRPCPPAQRERRRRSSEGLASSVAEARLLRRASAWLSAATRGVQMMKLAQSADVRHCGRARQNASRRHRERRDARNQASSRIVAFAMPPPSHIVCRP